MSNEGRLMETSNTLSSKNGHDVILVTVLPERFKCPFCKLLVRNAIQTFRGERACETCYIDAKGEENICPIDQEPIEKDEVFKDRHAIREVLQLLCYCNNRHNGCPWQGIVSEVQNHVMICVYESIRCEKCLQSILRKDADVHTHTLCPYRSVKCQYCFIISDLQSIEEHETTCTSKPMLCPYLCGHRITLSKLYDHVGNCPNIDAGNVCPYQSIGCKYQPHSREDLDKHLQFDNIVHAALTVTVFESMKKMNEGMKQDLTTEQSLRVNLSRKVEECGNETRTMETEVATIQNKFHDNKTEFNTLSERFDHAVRKAEEDRNVIEALIQEGNPKDMEVNMALLSSKQEELEASLRESSGIRNSADDDHCDSEEVKKCVSKVPELENQSAVLSVSISDMETKLQLLENASYNGRLLWKIDHVQYRINQAVIGKVTALHSAPCFKSRGSYKFCARLYLNGDGMGRGTHVSLFIVVMKSEFDALLQWPFSDRVTFRLINTINNNESIHESFVPDMNSSSFRRPTREMNIAAGCPMFVRKEKFLEFVVDDAVYIETTLS